MQNVSRKKKDFRLVVFESETDEFSDVTKASELLKTGKKICAFGYVNVNGTLKLVKTADLIQINIFENVVKLYTNKIEYNVKIA